MAIIKMKCKSFFFLSLLVLFCISMFTSCFWYSGPCELGEPITYPAISGHAKLKAKSEHSGIKLVFSSNLISETNTAIGFECYTSIDGSFFQTVLHNGNYEITASKSGYKDAVIDVPILDDGKTDIFLELEPLE